MNDIGGIKIKSEPVDYDSYNQSCFNPGSNFGTMAGNMDIMQGVQVKQEPVDGPSNLPPSPKKKGRKRKQDTVGNGEEPNEKKVKIKKEIKQELITDADGVKVKKKRDRFHGMPEEEVAKRTLPDLLVPDLDICIVGINPGLFAAYVGHHYAGPGNHFWKCLFLSGLIPEPLNAYHDERLKEFGIGFTNIVERTTRGSADLSRKEIKEGGEILRGKIQHFKPKIAVFNGKGIYEVFCGHKKFAFGKQPDHFPDCPGTEIFVMPSSSARCSQLPRAIDKVPFYLALKKYRDYLRGRIPDIDVTEITFPELVLVTAPKKETDETKPVVPKKEKQETKPVVNNLPEGQVKKKRVRKTKKQKEQEAAEKLNSGENTEQSQVAVYSQGHVENTGQSQPASYSQAQPQTSNTTIWNPMNQGMWQPASNGQPGNAQGTGENSNLSNVFENTSLVKQEDTSDLAEYGITASTFNGMGSGDMHYQQWAGMMPYMQNAHPFSYPPQSAYQQAPHQNPFSFNGDVSSVQTTLASYCPSTTQSYYPQYSQPVNMSHGQNAQFNNGGQQPPGQN